MDRFTNILLTASPGHLEPMMLDTAVDLAETNRARLTMLDVVEPKPRIRRFTRKRCRTFDDHAEPGRDRSERLRLLARNSQAGQRTDLALSVGQPSVEVTRHVLEHDNDLVIVGGGGAGSTVMPALPSGVMHLLRKCPVPVWVMRPPRPDKFRILALIDPDPDDPVRDGLNDRVLALATSLARRQHGELHVGHAMERTGGFTSQSTPHLAGEVADVLAQSANGVHRDRLGALLEIHRVAESGAELHLVTGHAGEVLPKLADGLRADLIVMGTVARTGMSGLIIGNTAETILQSVPCSVLAVKPEGFVTPVRQAMEMVA
jgi:nucleotide-binding universal stress UspA family protein